MGVGRSINKKEFSAFVQCPRRWRSRRRPMRSPMGKSERMRCLRNEGLVGWSRNARVARSIPFNC